MHRKLQKSLAQCKSSCNHAQTKEQIDVVPLTKVLPLLKGISRPASSFRVVSDVGFL